MKLKIFFYLLLLFISGGDKILFFELFGDPKMGISREEHYSYLQTSDYMFSALLTPIELVFIGYFYSLIQFCIFVISPLKKSEYFDDNILLFCNVLVPFLTHKIWTYFFQFGLIKLMPNYYCWLFGVFLYILVILLKFFKVGSRKPNSENPSV